MISRFFIYRPIFAGVLSILIVIIGGITIPTLPIEQTPDITPPTVEVAATYPGASAEVIAETVAFPIEDEVNGVEDMIYMSSKSSDDGTMTLTVSFAVGTDIDMATVLVQNRVAMAEPKLPDEVKREGLSTKKKSTAIVLMVNLISPDGDFDELTPGNEPDDVELMDQHVREDPAGHSDVVLRRGFGIVCLGRHEQDVAEHTLHNGLASR